MKCIKSSRCGKVHFRLSEQIEQVCDTSSANSSSGVSSMDSGSDVVHGCLMIKNFNFLKHCHLPLARTTDQPILHFHLDSLLVSLASTHYGKPQCLCAAGAEEGSQGWTKARHAWQGQVQVQGFDGRDYHHRVIQRPDCGPGAGVG